MKNKINNQFYFIIYIFTLFLVSCNVEKATLISSNRYRFIDEYRVLEIEFHNSGCCYLEAGGGSLDRSFTRIGYWESIGDNKIILSLPSLDSLKSSELKNSISQDSCKPNYKINWLLAHKNKGLVFPYIFDDTIQFSKNNKKFTAASFMFKKIKTENMYPESGNCDN